MKTSTTLSEFPGDLVRVACQRCDRRGQYRLDTLIDKYGADMRLPDLRHVLADCPRHGALGDACGVIFPDLAAKG